VNASLGIGIVPTVAFGIKTMTIEKQLLNFFLTNFDHPRKKFRQTTALRISDLPDEQASKIAELLAQRLNAETEPFAKHRLEKFKEFFEHARGI
jgi:hypothetical protein